jgi:hypothetical protein
MFGNYLALILFQNKMWVQFPYLERVVCFETMFLEMVAY